ncbi:MAG: GNAT family N-acetyltransferase [Lachnospiraceae bacterium]|nr:GNAT family N-acetyltransferase [Lachnospiraceae bacterium]
MEKFYIRELNKNDYKRVTEIYNSNREFLRNHLGVEAVEETFVSDEAVTMKKVGFHSCVIVNEETQTVQGVLDYKPDDEVYLSLMMLAAESQGKGIGNMIYSLFESQMQQEKRDYIRIDVVNDYTDNVIPFWEKLGFVGNETITLEWGNKKSNAVVMKKSI